MSVKIGVSGILNHLKIFSNTRCTFNVVNNELYVEVPERLRAADVKPSGWTQQDVDGVLRQQPMANVGYIGPRAG